MAKPQKKRSHPPSSGEDVVHAGHVTYPPYTPGPFSSSLSPSLPEEDEDEESSLLRVVVVGAGVAGLAAARVLEDSHKNVHVTVVEARNRVGGRCHTVTLPAIPEKNLNACDVDLGASYMHGCFAPTDVPTDEERETQPVFALAIEEGIAHTPSTQCNTETARWYDAISGGVVPRKHVAKAHKVLYSVADLLVDIAARRAKQEDDEEENAHNTTTSTPLPSTSSSPPPPPPPPPLPPRDSSLGGAFLSALHMLHTEKQSRGVGRAPPTTQEEEAATTPPRRRDLPLGNTPENEAVSLKLLTRLQARVLDAASRRWFAYEAPVERKSLLAEALWEEEIEAEREKEEREKEVDAAANGDGGGCDNSSGNGNDNGLAPKMLEDELRDTLVASDRFVCDGYGPFIVRRLLMGTDKQGRVCHVAGRLRDVRIATPVAAIEQQLQVKHPSSSSTPPARVRVVLQNGECLWAHKCVCTLPLGVLQRSLARMEETSAPSSTSLAESHPCPRVFDSGMGCVSFHPPLPSWKRDAVSRLGVGVENKVVLRFDEIFWPANAHYLYAAGSNIRFVNLHAITSGKCHGVLVAHAAPPHSIGWGGQTSDDDVVASVCEVLRTMLKPKKMPKCVDAIVTRWEQDAYASMSYTYLAVNSSMRDCETLRRPCGDVHFAGEAMSTEGFQCVQGAYETGVAAAREILDEWDDKYSGWRDVILSSADEEGGEMDSDLPSWHPKKSRDTASRRPRRRRRLDLDLDVD